ncbi:MAG: sigma-70 family RNA polymerase sigma factor [Firmicutes bacterium]|nr:sigma-70 family RNA polymerase sigma factor [Bacillota bacterium]
MDTNKQIGIHLLAYKNGDSSALEALMLLAYKDLFRLSLGYVKCKMLAEDIVSETFVSLIQKIHTIKNEQNLAGFLRTIVINKSLNLIKRRKFETQPDEKQGDVFSDTTKYSFSGRQIEKDFVVREILQNLDEPKRKVLLLWSYGHTLTEIVDITGNTINQVRLLLEKAKQNFVAEYESNY